MVPEPVRSRITRLWFAFDGLARDTLWSGAHDALALITALTSFSLLSHALVDGLGQDGAQAAFGSYAGIYGLLGAVGAFSYSGVGLALLQRLLGERDDPDDALRAFLSLALLNGVALGVLTVVLSLIFLDLTPAETVLIATAELVGTATVFVASILVQAASGFAATIRVRLVVVTLRLLIVVGLHLTGNLTILNLGAAFLFSFSLYAIYLLLVHLPRHGYAVTLGLPTGLSVRASGLFSIPMAAGKVQTDADKFLLPAFGHANAGGVYAAAYRILLLGITPLIALEAAAFQRFLPRTEGVAGVHWRRSTRLAALTLTASVFVAVALYLALPLLGFLIDDGFDEAFEIVPWLLPLIPLIATSGLPLNGLLGLGLAAKRMYIYLGAGALSLVLYFALIPPFNWRGAVVATYISEICLSVAGWTALWYHQRQADAALAASEGAHSQSVPFLPH